MIWPVSCLYSEEDEDMKRVAKVGSYLVLGAMYLAPGAGLDKGICVACSVGAYALLAALSW